MTEGMFMDKEIREEDILRDMFYNYHIAMCKSYVSLGKYKK